MFSNINENQESEKTDFNMAIESLRQISGWLFVANEAGFNLDSNNWYHALIAVFREISPFMREDELVYVKQEINNLLPLILVSQARCHKNGLNSIEPKLYSRLNELHLLFKKILKDKGMLMKMSDDAAKALK